jgi:hypothetical protein
LEINERGLGADKDRMGPSGGNVVHIGCPMMVLNMEVIVIMFKLIGSILEAC